MVIYRRLWQRVRLVKISTGAERIGIGQTFCGNSWDCLGMSAGAVGISQTICMSGWDCANILWEQAGGAHVVQQQAGLVNVSAEMV